MDKCFSNSLGSVKRDLLLKILLHLVQFVAMGIMILLDEYVFNRQSEVLSFFTAALVTVLISFFAHLSHYIS